MRVKLMRESLIAIVVFPFIMIALVGFYVCIGIFILGTYIYNGMLYLFPYEPLSDKEKKRLKRFLRLDGIKKK
jgi:hypothetical protein